MPQSADQNEVDVLPLSSSESETASNGGAAASGLDELRKILVQPAEVGDVLPDALKQRARKDDSLAEATLPIVEENIRQSVQRNPRILAEAIFPIIGPAIRKAISEALAQMVQSLNQTLERSLSPQGLKWRLEAMQTGKPFAEVVMLHSLLYRVEQVFLIHKKTGILLQHVSLNSKETQDSEMVSGMLTAIQDFVHDSFETAEDATLDSLKVRDFSIWIENSPDAILAAVIRGNAPLNLREVFLDAIERIQYEQEQDFEKFKGDTAVFEDTKPVLQECLQMQLDEVPAAKGKLFTPFNAIAGVLGILLIVGGFFFVRDYMRWSDFLTRLRNEPGIVVTEAERGFFKHGIAGLRDELAADPVAIAAAAGFEKDDIEHLWRNFQDADPAFVVRRAEKLLTPPSGVKLTVENGVLTADGNAPTDWFDEARKISLALYGVKEFRVGLAGAKAGVENRKILFVCGTTDFAADQEASLTALRRELELFADSAAANGKAFRVDVYGAADATGTDEINAQISRARADRLLGEVFARSPVLKAKETNFHAVGVGASGDTAECSARFRVFLD